VVLFELLTSKKLFLDTSEMGVLKKVQNGEIINPREINPDIDVALEKIILKSLNKNCDKRYQSAASMIADLETFMVKKYNYMPGPIQLSHFIYDLFEKEIIRDGIKVDLKPLPDKPLLREIAKAQPEPVEPIKPPMPFPVQESKVKEAAAPIEKPIPPTPPSMISEAEMHIDFDEDKILPIKKKATAAPHEITKAKPFFKEISEEKPKKPLWAIALALVLVTAAALGYFLVFKKSAPSVSQAEVKPAVEQKNPVQTPIVKQLPAVDSQVLEAEKLKQEEEQKKLLQAAEEKKKLQEDKRAKQVEADRLKKEEEDRLKQDEADRLQKEEAQKKQDESDRLAKEAADKKKADELKEIERTRVKEGDIIALNAVDTAPVAVSEPAPIISQSMRSNMADSQNVRFNILINQNGDVESVSFLQKTNNTQLNTVLINTIKTWKYTPATKNGVRVKVWKTVPLTIKK
jgi:TonB family protein